ALIKRELFQRNLNPPDIRQVGVSTYLALTFGTLLSSQGTDASFETVSPAPPGASLSVSPTLSDPFPGPFSEPFSETESPVGGAAFRRGLHFR
ncbi:hypothetical protein, partial [Streptomyces cacaoi]|uniref:hypothetical protein n=1 Tax=Streptomyces cacaoi TaxID=1898 RepID=UPI001CA86158